MDLRLSGLQCRIHTRKIVCSVRFWPWTETHFSCVISAQVSFSMKSSAPVWLSDVTTIGHAEMYCLFWVIIALKNYVMPSEADNKYNNKRNTII